MPEGSSITAALGPTNTGKTHRAVERMLTYDTGMIGLPLRLLAREVYDRVSARVGEERVALMTGEEKRVPRRPDYWVCTVEAMPIEREVDFLAVDEIQLCAHPQRGHVFTQRLLAARGRRETWFLGASTMRQLITELVPTAQVVEHPRLSRLSFAGAERVTRLPPRSAVVAFSTPQVYELAERLRASSGGCAVVLGALSPRTRNAQVAMFQAGEVDRLVATDAIGMGLNLHVSHVAFAALRKFDGREARGLEPAELAQIAGRAGRYQNDGSFGTLAPLLLSPEVAADIEGHRFQPVRRLVWRSAELDFSSIDALLASLRARPRARSLRLVEGAEDTAVLEELAKSTEIRSRARGEQAVRLLWEVCTVPDFRKLLLESHAALLGDIFLQLTGSAALIDRDWMQARVQELNDVSGDIDTLLARIASIRTWTYVAYRGGWVPDAQGFQDATREIEDRLSDALHDRLVQRFVERGGKTRRVQSASPRPAPTSAKTYELEAPRVDKAHPFAKLAALRAKLSPQPITPLPSEQVSVARWVEDVVAAPREDFSLDERGRIEIGGRQIGQLARGSRIELPDVQLLGLGELGAGARSRLSRRLVALARDLVGELLSPLREVSPRALSSAGQELHYQLERGLGTWVIPAGTTLQLSPEEASRWRDAGLLLSTRLALLPALLRPKALSLRGALVSAYWGRAAAPETPRAASLSLPIKRNVELAAYAALGYPAFGPRGVRADIAHRVLLAVSRGKSPPAQLIARWLACPSREATLVARAMMLRAPEQESDAPR